MPAPRLPAALLARTGAQGALLLLALWTDAPRVRAAALGGVAALALLAWLGAIRRRRAILDTPTARVASAPQGYVELTGRCVLPSGFPPLGLRAQELVLGVGHAWFRYRIEERDAQGKWRLVSEGRSDQSFILQDDSGQCLVDPSGAEVVTRHQRTWYEDGRRCTEWYLAPLDPLYAIGHFTSISGSTAALDSELDLRLLLEDWKRDQPRLLQRFDADGSGHIDQDEWEAARAAARTEVERQHAQFRRQDGIHTLRAPTDGRPYLIANLPPRQLAGRYTRWAWVHLLVFLAAGTGALMWLAAA